MAPPLTRNAARRRSVNREANDAYRCGELWQAARILRRFTASELLAVTEYGNRDSALAWLNKLRHAGFFRTDKVKGQREKYWVLVRNSGPKCPAIVRNRTAVWDHNTEQEYSIDAR